MLASRRVVESIGMMTQGPGICRWERPFLVGIAAVTAVAVLGGCGASIAAPATGRTLASAPPFSSGPSGCPPRITPAPTPSNLATYKVPGLDFWQVVSGPGGNLWFLAGHEVNVNVGEEEVLGSITPSGTTTLYPLPGSPGMSFAGITIGPDGNVWFTEPGAEKIGELVVATGQIETFTVPLPPVPRGSAPRNTQVTSVVAGPDGNLWFDVEQVAGEEVMPDGYVGRITPAGAVSLFTVPGGGQPGYIQVGADGNLWSRILVPLGAPGCALGGYAPSSTVVRVTPTGQVTVMSEDSAQFAGGTVGPGGDQWWMTSSGMLRRTTPSGHVTDFPADTSLGFWYPVHFVFGPDGNLWYVNGLNILRMTPTGQVSAYGTPGTNNGAIWITTGPDGRLWFVEGPSGAETIGALRPPVD